MRKSMVALFAALSASLAASAALAVEPDEVLKDPAQEARAREIGRELRCVVCQSQSIDDSNAPLARDLRLLVRERIVAGDTNAEVLDYVTARYGDYVLLKPRMSAGTLLLWLSPLAFLFAGGGVAFVYLQERKRRAPQTALSEDEQKRLDELTGGQQ